MNRTIYYRDDKTKLSYSCLSLFYGDEIIVDFSKFLPWWKCLAGKSRILYRLFRLEPRWATMISSDTCLVSFHRQLFVVSLKVRGAVDKLPVRKGFSNPLTFCSMRRFGRNELFFGDYGMNPRLEEINIYRFSMSKGLEIVYTFPAGTIKHVHNVIYDPWRNRFFILTGDFGKSVGIYEASHDFSKVSPFLIGNECYRAVVAKVLKDGLLWATDAVMKENHLYYKPFDGDILQTLCALNGSVIYGTELSDGLLFSTTVEPYPSKKSRLLSIIDNRKAPGIKSEDVDVIYVNEQLVATKVAQFKKDAYPMRLCQYGYCSFPYYENQKFAGAVCYPMVVKHWDGKEYKFN